MVWVSNQSSRTVVVNITNTSGGSADNYTIYPKQNEVWKTNGWTRKGDEKITVKYDGTDTSKSATVGPNAYVYVYDDTIGISQSPVTFV